MKHTARNIASAAVLAAAASPVFAHEGHEATGLLAGMLHPVTGADHLLVTLGLGLLAGLVSRLHDAGKPARAAWRMALAVVLGACAGVLMAGSGMVGPTLSALSEPAAALGLLVIALMMAGAERLGPRAMAFAAAAVSLPHGVLHGLESQSPAFLTGLVLTSVVLLAVGVALGRQITTPQGQGAVLLRRLTAAGYAGLGVLLVGMAV
jgi:urease accessory protein